jgi:hypothetical protein
VRTNSRRKSSFDSFKESSVLYRCCDWRVGGENGALVTEGYLENVVMVVVEGYKAQPVWKVAS